MCMMWQKRRRACSVHDVATETEVGMAHLWRRTGQDARHAAKARRVKLASDVAAEEVRFTLSVVL